MLLFVIEGIDGAGKTTTVKYLKSLTGNGDFLFLQEPTELPTGRKIREYLKNKTVLSKEEWVKLFDEDRYQNFIHNLIPNKEKTIIMDRYYISTAAYQGYDTGDVIHIFEYFYKKYPKPVHVFFLEIDIPTALERIKKRSQNGNSIVDTFEKEEELKRIYKNYKLLETLSESYTIPWSSLDARLSPQEIARMIYEKILAYREQFRNFPL